MKTVQRRRLKNPLVSIVMTAYNEAHCIRNAIQTLLNQSYKNTELLLVNNGSTDRTLQVMQEYKERRVRILSLKKNLGPGGGRNAGAKIAKGEILVFIDADMEFDKNYIKGLIRPIVEGKAVGTFHDTELVKNTENLWARSLCINRQTVVGETSGVFRAILRKPFLAAGGFDVSKGYFDDDLQRIGKSVRAHAVCYHNNPETLGEVFRHSIWVGRSLTQHPDLRKKYVALIIASWIAFLFFIALVMLHLWLALLGIVAASALGFLLFTLSRAIPRMIAEKRPEYLFSIPVLWSVRIKGYYVGACKGLFMRQ